MLIFYLPKIFTFIISYFNNNNKDLCFGMRLILKLAHQKKGGPPGLEPVPLSPSSLVQPYQSMPLMLPGQQFHTCIIHL